MERNAELRSRTQLEYFERRYSDPEERQWRWLRAALAGKWWMEKVLQIGPEAHQHRSNLDPATQLTLWQMFANHEDPTAMDAGLSLEEFLEHRAVWEQALQNRADQS